MMSSQAGNLMPIEGLSRREQVKLERLMEAEKAQKHGKTYKRKPTKEKHPEEPPQRKLIKTQQASHADQSIDQSSSIQQESKNKGVCSPPSAEKKTKNERNHLNINFPLEGNEQTVVDYLLMFSFTEKGKKMEESQQNFDFLENLNGITLHSKQKKDLQEYEKEVHQKFKQVKDKIDLPFDQNHLDFTKQICKKFHP